MFPEMRKHTHIPSYPDSTTPSNVTVEWARGYGVEIHPSGIVIPDKSTNNSSTIAQNFSDAISYIHKARQSGKHILILPGSYDLIHVGHLSFVVQATDHYLSLLQNQDLKREDLYIAMLIDDDPLLGEVKKDAYIKVTGQKGPIERSNSPAGSHPRTVAASMLPVDLVSFVPSPVSVGNFPKPMIKNTQHMQKRLNSYTYLSSEEEQTIQKALINFPRIEKKIKNKEPLDFDSNHWSIELWQLYLLSSLSFSTNGNRPTPPITRIVSQEESKYLNRVRVLMDYCNIGVEVINDVFCLSTKQLVEKYGVEGCLSIKQSSAVAHS